MYILVAIFEVLIALYFFYFASRPIHISPEKLSHGYISKETFTREEITGFGIAPIYEGGYGVSYNPASMGIYIICGNYDKANLLQYGIANVWLISAVGRKSEKWKKCIVNIGPVLTGRSKKEGVIIPDKMMWLEYSGDRYETLKSWLEQ